MVRPLGRGGADDDVVRVPGGERTTGTGRGVPGGGVRIGGAVGGQLVVVVADHCARGVEQLDRGQEAGAVPGGAVEGARPSGGAVAEDDLQGGPTGLGAVGDGGGIHRDRVGGHRGAGGVSVGVARTRDALALLGVVGVGQPGQVEGDRARTRPGDRAPQTDLVLDVGGGRRPAPDVGEVAGDDIAVDGAGVDGGRLRQGGVALPAPDEGGARGHQDGLVVGEGGAVDDDRCDDAAPGVGDAGRRGVRGRGAPDDLVVDGVELVGGTLIDADRDVRRRAQGQHAGTAPGPPLLGERGLELGTGDRGVAHLVARRLDGLQLAAGQDAVVGPVGGVPGVEEIGAHPVRAHQADDARGVAVGHAGGGPAGVGVGDEVGGGGLGAEAGAGRRAVGGAAQEVRADDGGPLVAEHRRPGGGLGDDPLDAVGVGGAVGGPQVLVGGADHGDLAGGGVVGQRDIGEPPAVMIRLDDRDVLAVGRRRHGRPARGRVGDAIVAAQDGVDVAGEPGGHLGGVGVGEHDDDVCGAGALELGGPGVGGGDGGSQGQRVGGHRGEEGWQVVGHDADEADLDAARVLDDGSVPVALGVQSRAGDIGRQVREGGRGQDPPGEVVQPLVELMVAQGGDVGAHGVEDVQGRLVVEQRRDGGRTADVVARGDEEGARIRLAGPGDLAGHGGGTGVDHLPGRGVGGPLDMSVQVGDAEDVDGGDGLLDGSCKRRGRRDERTEGQRRERGNGLHTGIRSHGGPGREEGGRVGASVVRDDGRVPRRARSSPTRDHTETPRADSARADSARPAPRMGRPRRGRSLRGGPGAILAAVATAARMRAGAQTMPWAIMTSATRVKPAALAPST